MNEVVPPTWWQRHWKWCLPVLIAGSAAALAAFIGLILWFVLGMMTSSDAYREAVARAHASPVVLAALGDPFKEGRLVTGTISSGGGSGKAELAIPLSGPRGDGMLYVVAREQTGQWTLRKLVFARDHTDQRTDLLPASPDDDHSPDF